MARLSLRRKRCALAPGLIIGMFIFTVYILERLYDAYPGHRRAGGALSTDDLLRLFKK